MISTFSNFTGGLCKRVGILMASAILLGQLAGHAQTPSVAIETPTLGAPVSGKVQISGWAIDNYAGVGSGIKEVQVQVDGVAVGDAAYGLHRSDVCNTFPSKAAGCPNIGFSYLLDANTMKNGFHTITVLTAGGNGAPDAGSASVTVVVSDSPPSVCIDFPKWGESVPPSGKVDISGWVIDNTTGIGTSIGGVQIKVDGVFVGNANYGSARMDVCRVYPGRPDCPMVGFKYRLDAKLLNLSPGLHTFTVTAANSDPVPQTVSQSVQFYFGP